MSKSLRMPQLPTQTYSDDLPVEAPRPFVVKLRPRSFFTSFWSMCVVSVALVLLIGLIDFETGYERSLSLFYLLPISLATWYCSLPFGLAMGLLSVVIWSLSDIAAGVPGVRLWNGGMALASYAAFTMVLWRLRTVLEDLDRRVRERTAALQREIAERERLDQEIAEVADRERRRLGQNLHDNLGQHLTGTALAAQVLREKLAARSAPEVADADKIVCYIEDGIDVTRNLARGFFSPELDADGLSVALQGLAENISERFGVACVFDGDEGVLVPDATTATQLYHIAQEATMNAVKHAEAQKIDIHLKKHGRRLELAVADDGVGFPEKLPQPPGLGLRLMTHGAALIGAKLAVDRNQAGGTTVTCRVTLSEQLTNNQTRLK
jgi:signal transduction histidine kinase